MYYITTSDHVKIAVYDLNPGSDKAILLIHGWPLNEKMYEYQKSMLLCAGYRVITMDLRGFGNSDAPACPYDYNRMADDIYTVVCKLNLRSFTLVGFSMGGAIVSRYMGRYQGHGVKKLCLLATAAPRFTQTADFPYGETFSEVNRLICLAETDRAQLSDNFSQMLLYSPHSESIKKWFADLSLSASGIATVQTGYALRDEDLREDLSRIKVPTGIFHGTRDQVVPYSLALQQQERIADSTLFTFHNSGHGIFYDELDCFNQSFLSYLKGSR
ncbi:alpha/beta fold hydrolase [Diplocloster modestus]|uniref:Alpha/beta hydrolase n=1 Tax=Diplocloster modestus TaxID=2850322 RepID=A0ABS6K4V2_9FIRM|nr:alpha/beta hydrolase [Diplocloster modestus]MBU9725508.1 alpha/beta hydrolase [Diplocloster modestus]